MAQQSAALRPILHLYSGFIVVWAWGLGVHLLGQWMPVKFSDQLGVVGNYLSLALLLVIWLERSKTPAQVEGIHITLAAPSVQPQPEVKAEARPDNELDELALLIQTLMLEQQPHLNSQITLERFAALLAQPPRQVSSAINRCFEQNFQEFINRFRIEEAKRRLQDPLLAGFTIVDIAQQAGFNSKATFNRLFKQQVGVTPSAYRQAFLPGFIVPQHHFAASQDLHNLN